MPLPHFLALIFAVIAAAGLTLLAATGFDLSLGVLAGGALLAALAVRALSWR